MSLLLSLEPPRGSNVGGDIDELSSAISDLKNLLLELLKTNGPAWAPFISQWTLSLLGEMSSRHSSLVTKVSIFGFSLEFKIALAKLIEMGLLSVLNQIQFGINEFFTTEFGALLCFKICKSSKYKCSKLGFHSIWNCASLEALNL